MSGVAVTKMHGTFNDFAVIDQRKGAEVGDPAGFARAICDRRGGIGWPANYSGKIARIGDASGLLHVLESWGYCITPGCRGQSVVAPYQGVAQPAWTLRNGNVSMPAL